MSVTVGLSN